MEKQNHRLVVRFLHIQQINCFIMIENRVLVKIYWVSETV